MSDNPVQRWHAHNPAATPTHADLKKGAAYAVGFADGHKQADRIEALTEARDTMTNLWAKEAAEKQVALGRIEALNAKLAKEGLREIAGECGCSTARAIIAEIEGEKG
jgi:RPA family protein